MKTFIKHNWFKIGLLIILLLLVLTLKQGIRVEIESYTNEVAQYIVAKVNTIETREEKIKYLQSIEDRGIVTEAILQRIAFLLEKQKTTTSFKIRNPFGSPKINSLDL